MAGFSDLYEDKVLKHTFGFGLTNFTPASPLWLALSKADLTDSGSGIAEPNAASGYHRKQVNSADFNAVVGGSLDNSAAIEFVAASVAWGGTITHFGIYDAVTNGSLVALGSLNTGKSIGANDTPRFAAGDLKISLD